MLFLVYSLDNPATGREIRKRMRAAHLRYVADNRSIFRYGGALLGGGGEMVGTLALIESKDRAALDLFLSNDPYNREGLFETVIVNQTRQTLPELEVGSLEAEISRAVSSL